MSYTVSTGAQEHTEFVLIGDPVAHSLSPIMHNALYETLGRERWPFASWRYEAIQCPNEESASYQIDLVRTGRYRGMNITMPYKKLALERADYSDCSADVAGGANVLVRNDDYKLIAHNTDGRGAIGAIERVADMPVEDRRVVICGTGPTSLAIAAAAVEAGADSVALVSRNQAKAQSSVNRIAASFDTHASKVLHGMDYACVSNEIANADIIVDATPCGMKSGDGSVIDTSLLHEGQVVLDTVYGHGETELLKGALEHGATAMDGLEMLVEQAALSVEIWASELALPLVVDRSIMRNAAQQRSRK